MTLARLETWMRQDSLIPAGSPIYGYFDLPWTPAFLRRNEVMLRLAKQTVEEWRPYRESNPGYLREREVS